MEQENNNYQPDAQAFLDAMAKDETAISPRPQQQILEEAFPFTDEFDIDAFIAANDSPLEKTLTAIKANPVPQTKDTKDFNINLQKDKDDNIKELETKINDIQNQIADTSKEQDFSSLPSELFEEQPAPTNYVSSIKANDEFFSNISNTIDTLKGSLDNIVKARLQYEEGLVRQDQNLIARLREKTSRLKAINLALNSEVKRAKNEKLESLRKSAEQTKELLALRMQLNQFQEESNHGFKFSRLEQQLSMAQEEKKVLEEEIAKIRHEKLESFKASAEQTRQIMALRFDLAKTEDKFKQQEAQTLALQSQLEDFRQKALAGDKDLYQGQIAALQNQLEKALFSSKNEAGLAGSLRENILFLETALAKSQGAKTALLAKAGQHLETLFNLKNKYEQEINLIKDAQLKLLEKDYNLEDQKTAELATQTKQTLAVCRQQESFIKNLQAQIDSFKQAIKDLEDNSLENTPAETALLKDANLREISALQKTLQEEQNKYRNKNLEYQNLSARLSEAEKQKQTLEEQVASLLTSKEDIQKENNQYISQIEALKKDYESLQTKYSALNSNGSDKQMFDLQKNALEDELKTILTQKIALLAQVEERNKTLASFKAKSEEQTKQLKEEAAQQISVLENKLVSAEEKLKNEEENVSNLKDKIARMQAAFTAKETANKNMLSQQLSALKDQLLKAQEKATQGTVLFTQLKEESNSKKEEFSILEKKYNDLISQKEDLQKTMQEQASQIESLKTSLENLQKELAQEKAARVQLEEKVSKLKAVNVALSAQIKQAQQQKIEALKKSAEQAKEIVSLKEELAKAENFKTIEFENGMVKIRQEYETKISALEKQLQELSEKFAKQVQEIESLKTDNAKLKKAQEEKFTLEEEYNTLTTHAKELEEQISSYKKNATKTALVRAKAAALTMQLTRIKEEKKTLADQLDKTRAEIKNLTDDGKEAHEALDTLRTQISQNDDLITKLKQDITALKEEKAKEEAKKEKTEKQESLKNSKPLPPPPPPAPVIKKEEPKTDTFSQTYTEPPTLSEKKEDKTLTSELKNEGATLTSENKQENKPLKENTKKTEDSTFGAVASPVMVTDSQKEALFEEILPDMEDGEYDTFAEASELDNGENTSNQPGLDLSMIFGAKESIEVQDLNQTKTQGTTEHIKLSPVENKENKEEDTLITDHSMKTHLSRKATMREGEEYSDFLGKTKSVFYRIKWSLFKE